MVNAREHLGQKPHCYELNPDYDEKHPEKKERTAPYGLAQNNLRVREVNGNHETEESHDKPGRSEGMNGARRETLQEFHRYEVQQHPYSPRYPVIARAVKPRMVPRFNLGYGGADPARHGRNEAVHLSVKAYVLYDVFPVRLERASVIMETHSRHPRYDAVRNHRRKTPRYELILPPLSPSAHDVKVFYLFEHHGDVLGVVLKVRVHGDDYIPLGVFKPRGYGRGLPEVLPEGHDYDSLVF